MSEEEGRRLAKLAADPDVAAIVGIELRAERARAQQVGLDELAAEYRRGYVNGLADGRREMQKEGT